MNDFRVNPLSENAETEITLGLLSVVQGNQNVSQRSAAQELGIALGLANAYFKRCIKKGLIKAKQAPANRFAYYLTPKGLSEKGKLTAKYLTTSFNFFRTARLQCSELFGHCEQQNWNRVTLIGTSDLAEIATLCAFDFQVSLVAIVDDGTSQKRFAGLPVVNSLRELEKIDACIITDFMTPREAYERTALIHPHERILAPRFLQLPSGQSGLKG